jgi:hypothetical protein
VNTHPYTEDQLVEQPAIGLFAELGWQVALPHPHPGPLPGGEGAIVDESGLFGREMSGEVLLVSRLRAALERLNPGLPRVYSPEMYRRKCSALFEHVYESYPERNEGVYSTGA